MAWLNNYRYRQQIAIPNTYVDADLVDFIYLHSIDSANIGAKALSNGYDIVFTMADGTTLLPFYRRSFAIVGGTAIGTFSIKTNISSTSATIIYMYYGNPFAIDMSSSDTFDSTHICEFPLDTDYLDSTKNNIDGTNNGTSLVSGKVNQAADFNGSTYIQSSASSLLDISGTNRFTIGGWFKTTSKPADSQMGHCFSQNGYNTNGFSKGLGIESSGKGILYVYTGLQAKRTIGTTRIDDNNWHYLSGTYDGTHCRLYVDGALQATQAVTGTQSLGSTPRFVLGFKYTGNSFPLRFYGYIGQSDEVSISNQTRSAAWIKFQYYNMGDGIGGSWSPVYSPEEEFVTEIVNNTVDLLWDNRAFVSDELILLWDDRESVNNTSVSNWNVLELISNTSLFKWNTHYLQPITKIYIDAIICNKMCETTYILQSQPLDITIHPIVQLEV